MKTTSKILSILLVLSMVIAMLPGMSLVSQAADEVVLDDVMGMYAWVTAGYPELDKKELAINDAKDFRNFQQELGRFGKTFEGYTIYLTADLVLNEDWDSSVSLDWEIIDKQGVLTEDSVQTSTAPSYAIPGVSTTENKAKLKQFGGIFDGMGHSVSGLYLNQNSTSAGSLFGQAIGTAEIKNLAVLNSYFANGGTGLSEEAKPLAGFFTKVPADTTAKISNCYVDIDLYEKSTSTKNLEAMFGGLVGYVAGTLTIENTVYAGSMSFNPTKGAGRLDGTGGFVGRVNGTSDKYGNVTVKNSVFAGKIWSPYQRVAGGIGRCQGYANINMENCLILGRYYGVSNAAALLSSVLVQGSVVQNVTINDCYTINTDTSTLLIAAGTNNKACSITANVNGVAKYTLNTAVTGSTKDASFIIDAADFTGLNAEATLKSMPIGGKGGTLADVFTATMGIVFPGSLYAKFEKIANNGLTEYKNAAEGDLLYTVDFSGNDGVFNPSMLNNRVANKTYTASADGTTLFIDPIADKGVNLNVYGSPIGGYTASEGTYYTMTYKLWVDKTQTKTTTGIGGIEVAAGAEDATGKYMAAFVNFNNGKTGFMLSDTSTTDNTASAMDAPEMASWATETIDGKEYNIFRVTYDNTNHVATSYVLKAGCSGEKAHHWIKLYSKSFTAAEDARLLFSVHTTDIQVNAAVRDVKYYKGSIFQQPKAYEDAANGELLYEVDFRGDDVYTPSMLNNRVANKTYTASADGAALAINPIEGKGVNLNVYGGAIGAYTATEGTYYTMTYKLWVDKTQDKTTTGIGGIEVAAGAEDATAKFMAAFVNYNNGKTGFMLSDTATTTNTVPGTNDRLSVDSWATETIDGKEYNIFRVTYDNTKHVATSYVLKDGCSGELNHHWIKLRSQEFTAMDDARLLFSVHTTDIQVTSVVRDVKYYKGNIVGDIEIPAFAENGNRVNAGNGNYKETYTNVTADQVNAYINTLIADGWTRVDGKAVEVGNNVFATFAKGEAVVHLSYFATLDNGRLNIICGTEVNLVPQSVVAANTNAVTPSVSIIERTDGNLCMVVQLADGTFVVIDGGYGSDEDKVQDSTYLKPGATAAEIHRNYKQDIQTLLTFMQNKTTGKPQVIWMFTHGHADHMGLAIKMMAENTADFDLLAVAYNFPSYEDIALNPEKDTAASMNGPVENLLFAAHKYFPNAAEYVFHTGQVWQLPGVEIEFLFTSEDMNADELVTGNHTSNIWRFNFTTGESLMITGDSEEECNKQITNVFGSYLKSDMLQVVHHGTNGATLEFYQAVDPTICFWPTLDCYYENDMRHLGTLPFFYYNYWLRNNKTAEGLTRIHYTTSATHTVEIGKPAHTHAPAETVVENKVDATCGADGSYEEVVKCECGHEISRTPKVIPATGAHIYDEGVVTKEPTYTETGVKTYTCGTCGDTKTEDIPMLEKTVVDTKFTGKSLALEGAVTINLYVTYTVDGVTMNEDFVEANAGVLYWSVEDMPADRDAAILGTETHKADVKCAGVYQGNTEFFAMSHGIPAKCYGDTVYFRTYILVDGEYQYGEVEEYSILAYCENVFKNQNKPKLESALVALLNYGSAAQTYFAKTGETPVLVNAGFETYLENGWITADMLELSAADKVQTPLKGASAEMTVNFAQSGVMGGTSKSLALEGAIATNYYVAVTDHEALANAQSEKAYFWTEAKYNELQAAGIPLSKENASYVVDAQLTYSTRYGYEYFVASEQVPAPEWGNTQYMATVITDANGVDHCSGVITYSPLEYAAYLLNNGVANREDPICEWLIAYSHRAIIALGR